MVYIILFAFVLLFFLLTGAAKKRMEYRRDKSSGMKN